MRILLMPLVAVLLFLYGPVIAGDTPLAAHALVAELEGDFSGLPEQDAPVGARFGFSMAMYGNTLAVGAPGTRVGTYRNRGAVFVFRYIGGQWVQTQRLLPGSGSGEDQCGYAVALDRFNLLVGCPFHVDSSDGQRGRARLYTRSSPSADFQGSTTFTDSGEISGAQCGRSVALIGAADSGSFPFAAVGCPGRGFELGGGLISRPGAVDIYHWFLDWNHAASVSPASQNATGFGNSLALTQQLDELLLVVGQPGTSNGQARVYAMGATAADWSQEQVFTGPTNGSQFGYDLHMRFGRLVVGAPSRSVPTLIGGNIVAVPVGSVSIAYRVCPMANPCGWFGQVDEILGAASAPAAVAQNRLGHAVQMLASGRLIAGEPAWPITVANGRARHYLLDGGSWLLNQNEPFYAASAPPPSAAASALAGDGGWLAIGAPAHPTLDDDPSGRVFVYAWNDGLFSDRFEQ